MDYLFSRQSGSWYLTGLTESETKPEQMAASAASQPAPMADSDVEDAILATGGEAPASSAAASAEAGAEAEPQAESAASPAA